MMLLAAIALIMTQPETTGIASQTDDENRADNGDRANINKSQTIVLTPPIGMALRMNKVQTHDIGNAQIKHHSMFDIIFKPSSNPNIIGYDISIETISIKTHGDEKLLGLLNKTQAEIGSISHFSYDSANDILTLKNADALWQNIIKGIEQIELNAGKRSDAQKVEDKKLLDAIKNLPPKSRQAILSQDMALLLSFVGKTLPDDRQNDDNMLIKSRQSIDRQNGLIKEMNDFHVSPLTGLVHKLMRTNETQGDKKRKITTLIEVTLP